MTTVVSMGRKEFTMRPEFRAGKNFHNAPFRGPCFNTEASVHYEWTRINTNGGNTSSRGLERKHRAKCPAVPISLEGAFHRPQNTAWMGRKFSLSSCAGAVTARNFLAVPYSSSPGLALMMVRKWSCPVVQPGAVKGQAPSAVRADEPRSRFPVSKGRCSPSLP